LLGPEQRLILKLCDSKPHRDNLKGLKWELQDSHFPLIDSIVTTNHRKEAFKNADYTILVGTLPQLSSLNHAQWVLKNSEVYMDHGKAIGDYAKPTCKVLCVGAPANANAIIVQNYAPSIPAENFHALTRVYHNRAKALLSSHTDSPLHSLKQIVTWGNSSNTIYPDLRNTLFNRVPI
jgi:malate dehydrogenase